MAERINDQLAEKRRGLPPALAWLRARLLPRGEGVMMVVAYAMILTALVSFILLRSPGLPGWRFSIGVLALSALLVLNLTLVDLEALLGHARATALYLGVAAALFLLANWAGSSNGFFPYLLFMLTSQAFVSIRARYALLYSLVLPACWIGQLWIWGFSTAMIVSIATQIGLGLLFTAIFSIVVTRYGEQKAHAEALLRELQVANAELAAAREREKDLAVAEERVRLARDIHDGLGHHLTVLNVQLQAAAKLVGRDPDRAASAIATCREQAQAALDEVRRSVAAMRTTPLDGRTLDQALTSLVGDFDRRAAVEASFELRGTPRPLTPAAAMTLYRAAQEGLTNAQKYAAAQHVAVTLDFAPQRVRLAVQDDGTGNGEVGSSGGFGLAGLRERAEQLGGRFSAQPAATGGFLLELELPN